MTSSELYEELSSMTGTSKSIVKDVVKALGELAQSEVADGSNFNIPGVCRFAFSYTKPVKKGTKSINPFTKEEVVAAANKPGKLKLRVAMAAQVKRSAPSLTSKVGKTITAA